eukprot:TRINITY_DN3875_c0_g3_i2.p1 TRINITY_DN3875_c0_g3~~TRINITY_DN3875_c0_g3_i2.p1  ORF type:complete len:604 (-),score=53.76 TRINITY_DN3875_c0_g3_i2:37-1848(-)
MAFASLSIVEVAALMRESGHGHIADKMQEDEVDGEALALLTVSDFVEYGLKKGPALKMVNQLQQMSANPEAFGLQVDQPLDHKTASPLHNERRPQLVSISAFVSKWHLDSKAHDALCQLDSVTQERVMNDFAPPPNTTNVSAVFMSWLKSFAGVSRTGAATSKNDVNDFVARWRLDAIAQDVLLGLDSNVRQKVMADFNAPDISRANQMFMGFVKGVMSRFAQAPVSGVSERGGLASSVGNRRIDSFVAKWGLDNEAVETLCRLDYSTQQKVMTDFSPPDRSRANRIFMGFVRSVASRVDTEEVGGAGELAPRTGDRHIDDFVSQWGLDRKSLEVLCSLDSALQQRIMSGFAPPNEQRANQMFMGFVKSVLGRTDSVGGDPSRMSEPSIDAFLSRWGLDAQSEDVLLRLEPATQRKVMTDFAPSNPDKANQMFMSFVRGVKTRVETAPPTSGGRNGLRGGDSAFDRFIAQWNLDSQAVDALRRCDPEVQDIVLRDFNPPNPERANQMFMGFIKRVASRVASTPGGGNFARTSRGSRSGEVDSFLERWCLDDKCRDLLCSLDDVTQERIMSGFSPPNPKRANQMFMGFVKSIAGARASSRSAPY